jgi:hypothetical protein
LHKEKAARDIQAALVLLRASGSRRLHFALLFVIQHKSNHHVDSVPGSFAVVDLDGLFLIQALLTLRKVLLARASPC